MPTLACPSILDPDSPGENTQADGQHLTSAIQPFNMSSHFWICPRFVSNQKPLHVLCTCCSFSKSGKNIKRRTSHTPKAEKHRPAASCSKLWLRPPKPLPSGALNVPVHRPAASATEAIEAPSTDTWPARLI